ncbi:Holliday junction branch migration protein RuvA [Aliifodinibius salipaludis]|uniref:Holliday junction branch migration complex subunit RuvA n=1 Tax=Fodinibius salipaludis TaxID=2032627 RepID=A0A2A2GER5_9BACT|nr:Holliday junction branch migration protein RuvA [Aliifodinibius salipaludis]PAU95355.1 Holliday junction branch migration protein RuvA [Aliifodinibius salipaludis]
MIAYLKGIIHDKSPDQVIIDVRDVGYLLEISNQTYNELPATGDEVELLVYHHVTDNDQRLFGFANQNEKDLFELLITVKGVGPKLGLTILSGLPAQQITGAIVQEDKSALSQIKGIGKKTAQRMILELKDKMSEMVDATYSPDSAANLSSNIKEEAVSALQSLGFKKRDAEESIELAAKGEDIDGNVQELVKKALSQMDK